MASKSSKKPKAAKKATKKVAKKATKKAVKKATPKQSTKGKSYKATSAMNLTGDGEHRIVVSKDTRRDAVLYVRIKPANMLALQDAASKQGVTLAAFCDQVIEQLVAQKVI